MGWKEGREKEQMWGSETEWEGRRTARRRDEKSETDIKPCSVLALRLPSVYGVSLTTAERGSHFVSDWEWTENTLLQSIPMIHSQ